MVHPMEGPADIAELVRACADDGPSRPVALDLLRTGRPMWRRSEFVPGHFTASGFVASPDGARLLLVRHAKLRRRLQPGGHFEAGDATVEDAIRREVAEETGLVAMQRVGHGLLRIDVHGIPPHAGEPSHLHIDLAMGFIASDASLDGGDPAMAAHWVPFDALAEGDADDAVLASAERLVATLGSPGR
jgi:8-oxo-dGTP pyrophosphatase MutT (NUDIX family)